MTRVDSTGTIDTTVVDLTPRSGHGPHAPPLKVPERAVEAVEATISALESTMNAAPASTGSRALYTGLARTGFSGVPVIVISSGLDLANPVDFRTLNWTVPPEEIVTATRRPGELPDLHHAPVTFVVVPPSGSQAQLREPQKRYRNDVWAALLTAGGASLINFVDAAGGGHATSPTPAPAVEIPVLPATPIRPTPDPTDPRRNLCQLPSSTYFRANEAVLIDKARTVRDLEPCVSAARAAGGGIGLDGWTSYVGPLAPDGRPVVDDPSDRALSQARVQAIADLMVIEMDVPRSAITRLTGHGSVGQPDPDPRSPANRVVVISYRAR